MFPSSQDTHRTLTDGLTSVFCLHVTVDSVRFDGGVRLDQIHFRCLPSFPNDLLALCKKASLRWAQGQKQSSATHSDYTGYKGSLSHKHLGIMSYGLGLLFTDNQFKV